MIDLEQLTKLIRDIVREELAAAKPAVEPEHVTVAVYAAKHSLGVSTVRQAIREKRLPATKIGRAVRVATLATITPPQSDVAKRKERVLAIVNGSRS